MSTGGTGQTRLDAPGASDAEWIAAADRLAPLIDGVEYFRAVRSSLIKAREQVLIVGWELHSEIDLLRGEEAEQRDDEHPIRFADLLLDLVERRDDLHVHLLIWEGASLFALERQHLPRMKRPWFEHPRITLVWDRDTPPLASQHQKIAVIDDRVAYVGGMDLTKSRWDDHAHHPDDERRKTPGLISPTGKPYHDLMVAVDGEAARILGGWCRERWRRATGSKLPAPSCDEPGGDALADTDRWPGDVRPALRDQPVAIVLTEPDFGGRVEKRQVESSYVAQIRGAERLIFVETQYFTAPAIAEAIGERLKEPDGPEVIVILPYGCEGRLQAMALDPHRDRLLDRLRRADEHGRLGVYWATLDDGSTTDVFNRSVYVHAKTMVVDDRLLRIGSANLNNRSMGVDTELDVFTQVDDEASMASIARYRRRLLAYLLHVDAEQIADAEERHGSVLAAVEHLRGGRRTLHPFEHNAGGFAKALSLPLELADPDRPLGGAEADRLRKLIEADKGILDRVRRSVNAIIGTARRSKGLLALIGVVVALAAVWTFTPLSDQLDRESVAGVLESISSSTGVVGITTGFILLATVGAPVTILIGAVGSMFGIWWALPICLVGVTASALAGFAIGRVAPRRISRSGGGRLQRIGARLADRGVLAVTVLRNLPIAPFAVINIACGLTSIPWWKFMLGTVLGMLPGIVLIGAFGSELGGLVLDPTPLGLLKLAGIAVLVIVVAVGADAAFRRWGTGRGDAA